MSIRTQTYKFIIYPFLQEVRVDKQTNRSQFSWACPVINNEFRPNIVNVSCEPTIISRDNFQTKFMMSNRTDEWHTFVSAHTFCASLKAKFDINAINYATKYTTKAREYSTLADFCRKTADFLSGWNRFKICRTIILPHTRRLFVEKNRVEVWGRVI